ncbi:MAG: hypothetical protein AB1420_12615 [Bacillota bacterium]
MHKSRLRAYHNSLSYFIEQAVIPKDSDAILESDYCDLSYLTHIKSGLFDPEKKLPDSDYPLGEVSLLITRAINHNYLDKIKIGLNELLKGYLRKLEKDNQANCTHLFISRVKETFQHTLLPSFPHTEEVWLYLCKCLQPVGYYLLENGYIEASVHLADYVAAMGKTAAKKGLHTDKIQQFFRMIELKAMEMGLEHLSGHVKNHRHNIEL